jgi:hypothetical protein
MPPQQQKTTRRKRQRFEVTFILNGKQEVHEVEALSPAHAFYESDLHKKVGGYGCSLAPNWAASLTTGQVCTTSLRASVGVKCLGEVGRRTYTETQREERRKTREAAEAEKVKKRSEMLAQQKRAEQCNRTRIVNQIDHAFLTKTQNAGPFITCDYCSDKASVMLLTHEAEGSTILNEQIAGARCESHFNPAWNKTPFIDCVALEFFFDGVKQIHINHGKKAKE